MKFILYIFFVTTIIQSSQAKFIYNYNIVTIKQVDMKYYCPIHPAVVSEKQGKCSKCGMELKKKDSDSQSPLVALLDKPTNETNLDSIRVQTWVLNQQERKSFINYYRDSTTDSIISNRLKDSTFINLMLKGTHHIVVRVTDTKGKEIGKVVQVQTITPEKNKISTILNAMLEYYEGSLNMKEKGVYKITVYVINNGKTQETQFSYNVE